MASPRVLLLGGHGKVAMHLTPLLLNRGWDVSSVIRNPAHSAEILRMNDHEGKASGGDRGGRGTVEPLVSSLEDVKSVADAGRMIETTRPDYIVWAAGAGGAGTPAQTYAVDQDAAKHFVRAAVSDLNITKFLLISHLGSRRLRAPWWTDEDWESGQKTRSTLPDYYKAKLEADEYFTAMAMKRREHGEGGFQDIALRPGLLSDDPATGKVQLGHTRVGGSVSREDVAIVADRLLARSDTRGSQDLLAGDVPIDEAIEKVTHPHVSAIEGEDVDGMLQRFAGETSTLEFKA